MSQTPSIAWETAPAVTSAPEVAPTVAAKVEDFATVVQRRAEEQIGAIKMSHDQTRMNEAVTKRVAELVIELGLPPPRTEAENIETLAASRLDEFENERLNFLAVKKAREIFFDRHPEMATQQKKQNVEEATQAMSEALMGAFLRFLRDEHQAEQRREAREAAKKKA